MALRDEILADMPYAYWGMESAEGAIVEPDLSPVPSRPGIIPPGAGITRFTQGVQGGSMAGTPLGTDPPGGAYELADVTTAGAGVYGNWPRLKSGVGQTDWTFECCVAPMEYTIGLPAESTSASYTTTLRTFLTPPNEGNANGGIGISIGTNGIVVHEFYTGVLAPLLVLTQAFAARVFVHLVLTMVNRQPKLYINGTLARTGLTSVRTLTICSNHLLGDPWSGFAAAYVDEVAWYTGALATGRITAHGAAAVAQWPATQKMPLGGGLSLPQGSVLSSWEHRLQQGLLRPETPRFDSRHRVGGDLGTQGRESTIYTRRPGSRFTTFPRVA